MRDLPHIETRRFDPLDRSDRVSLVILTLAGALHARGRVDGVSEEAVARHGAAHHPRHARPRVDAHAHLDVLVGPVRHHARPDALQQVQRHGRDLPGVSVLCEQHRQAL